MAEVYLDTTCFIHLLEGDPPVRNAVEAHLRALPATDGVVTSRLTRLECRVKPLREADHSLLARYAAALAPPNVRLLDLSEAVVERATELRARYGFRTPDALHLASAIESGAASFITGDARLAKCREIPVAIVPP